MVHVHMWRQKKKKSADGGAKVQSPPLPDKVHGGICADLYTQISLLKMTKMTKLITRHPKQTRKFSVIRRAAIAGIALSLRYPIGSIRY